MEMENRRLTGKWHMRDWRHEREEDDKKRTETSDAALRQTGNEVTGEFRNDDGAYELSGMVSNDLIWTGTWRHKVDGVGGKWHGVFQFKILDQAKRMLGRWVGFDSNIQKINCGVWEWRRHGVEKYPTELEPSATWQGRWGALGLRERIAIGVAVITAVGVVVAALVRILPDMIK